MFAAVDIGGTKTLVAVFDAHGKIVEQIRFPTPKDYKEFKMELAKVVDKLSTQGFKYGCVGIRGNIDRAKGLSLYDDILIWGEVKIRDDCVKIFGCPFLLENDSKLAGLSEAVLMKAEFSKVLYLTISTGIGSAFVLNGKLDQNTIDSEVGKSLFEHEGLIEQWEDFASGKAIVAKYHKRASDIEDPIVWEAISKNIALGLVNVIAAFTPQIVVFGGGVGTHFSKFKQPLKQALITLKPREISLPALRRAQRPEEAVLYGCYELVRQHEKSAS
jgi:predicted NBD/HSP70 family sugar kinase